MSVVVSRRARWPAEANADYLAALEAEPERYELHHQDKTHLEANPYWCRVWHRKGQEPTVPAAGANRRVTAFGSVEDLGRGQVEVACARQDSACFPFYLEALDARSGREMGRAITAPVP